MALNKDQISNYITKIQDFLLRVMVEFKPINSYIEW